MSVNQTAPHDHQVLSVIGLMSGTSMDGVDAALLYTDGITVERHGPSLTIPYGEATRARMKRGLALAAQGAIPLDASAALRDLEREVTDCHLTAVRQLCAEAGVSADRIDVIGFHGHTVLHRPERQTTWQIGDGARLARQTGITVVSDFRSNDVAHGGQGAPLVPIYHAALLGGRVDHAVVAVLNIGGVANVTWVSFEDGIDHPRLLAFDTGPGSALLDDWAEIHTGTPCDTDGLLAARGTVHPEILTGMMDSPYFDEAPPKSLDRDDFTIQPARGLSAADGAATLTAFTVAAAVAAQAHFPMPPEAWYVCGGGRHNRTLMTQLRDRFPVLVEPVDVLGLRGDFLEAEAFGFLAARALQGLPLSYPSTTGVGEPLTGGVVHRP